MTANTDIQPEATPLARLPLVLRWGGADAPLPMRAVRNPSHFRRAAAELEAPSWLQTGPLFRPFDFCGHIRALCADITTHCRELAHIDVSRLLFGMMQARSSRLNGLQARVTPLRFHRGDLLRQRRGVCYQVQRYVVDGREMLYLVTFCLPRFLNRPFDDKFITLFHELFHISAAFDGDFRRHKGRYGLHSHSKKDYDAQMAQLARSYLSRCRDARLHHFLRLDFAQLVHRHGGVVSIVVPHPKLVPVTLRPGNLAAASRSIPQKMDHGLHG
jgi:hypothetical protein